MPTFEITSPDGKTFEVTGPEGSTKEQALEKVKAQHAAPPVEQRSGIGDFIKSIPGGLVQGFSTAASALGKATAGEMGQHDLAAEIPGAEQGAAIMEKNVTGSLPKPQGFWGRVGRGTGEVAGNPASYLGPGSMTLKLGSGAASVLGSEAAGELTNDSPLARVGGGVAGAVTGAGLVGALRSAVTPKASVAADLARAMERDGQTPEQLMQALQQARQSGRPNATIADVGGENVRGLVERVAQTPGAGRTTVIPELTERQTGQMARLSEDLSSLTGSQRTATQAIEQTMAQRQAAANPLYDQAFNFNARAVPEIVDEWMRATGSGWGQQILNSPDFRRTLETAYGIKDPQLAPLMRVIDAWKKEADGMVGEAIRSGNNNRARVISEMRDQVVGVVDQHNPAYQKARDAWSGPSRYIDNIEEGRTILSNRVSAEELTARLAGMTDADREAYRIGAVSAVRGKMGNDPAKMADMTKYLRSPEMRAKIAAIMPTPEAAQRWGSRLDYEVGSSELTGRALGNSATARRLAERADADGIVGDLVMGAFAHGPSLGLLQKVLMWAPNRVKDSLRSRADQLLAEVLVQPAGGARIGPALQGAPQAGGQVLSAAAARGALTSPLAPGADSALAQPQP